MVNLILAISEELTRVEYEQKTMIIPKPTLEKVGWGISSPQPTYLEVKERLSKSPPALVKPVTLNSSLSGSRTLRVFSILIL